MTDDKINTDLGAVSIITTALTEKILVEPTVFEVSCLPMNDINRAAFTVDVVLESSHRDEWAVKTHGIRHDSEGRRERELLPGETEEHWRSRYRFTLASALALAVKLAPKMTLYNGYTVADALADRKGSPDG